MLFLNGSAHMMENHLLLIKKTVIMMILDKRDPQVNMLIEPWWRQNIPHIHKVLTLSEEMEREIGKACEKVYTKNSQLWK
jgi:hypothetical protein